MPLHPLTQPTRPHTPSHTLTPHNLTHSLTHPHQVQESEEGAARKTQARTLKSRTFKSPQGASQSEGAAPRGQALRGGKPPAIGFGGQASSAAVSAIAASQAAHNDAPRAAGAPPPAAAEGVAGADAASSTPRPASTPGYERRINKGTPLATKKTSSAALFQGLIQAQAQSAKPKTQKAPNTEGWT